jgi:hypothetical protein
MLLSLATLTMCASAIAGAETLRFSVRYAPSITDSYTGRVYVISSTSRHRQPRFGPSWFGTAPLLALDVTDWKPDTPLVFDDDAIAYPGPISELKERPYWFQAVMRLNRDGSSLGSPGNAYSSNKRFDVRGDSDQTIQLTIDQVDEPRAFAQNDRIRLVELRSDLLSQFHGRDVIMRAVVILPKDYDKTPQRQYPVLYWIDGFGSNYRSARRMAAQWDRNEHADDIVRVVLDASCYGGHHVFADSANNGPRGTALVEELIPHLEQQFRLAQEPTARFLSGHSSGGWSSLWLQVAYPDTFGGVWSIAPDPVDFHDFQQIDLYAPNANMYVDETGQKRALARRGGQPVVRYEDFARMEVVVGEGGQLRSFEWVFSPRGADGLPLALYDRKTGAIDPEVAKSWRPYDIRLRIEENWETLEPKLTGKVYVVMGDQDDFYLDGATVRLKETMERLGSDARIDVIAGGTHGSVRTRALMEQIDEELLEVFQKARKD